MDTILFKKSAPFTLGVELEFQILDKDTLALTPQAPALLESVPPELSERIKPEFIRSMIEINTDICASVSTLADDLRDLCRRVEKTAASHNCLLYAASLHPSAKSHEQELSDQERYKRILDDLQIVGRRFITQGLHVHVGISDSDTAIRVCDNIRIYLPILLALTTSSPFYEGQDTGLCSYRAKLFEALPLAGVPDHLGSWEEFQKMAALLTRTGIIGHVRDLWWDVRPHPDFGTVEVRICDLPASFTEILAMTALIQALVVFLAESGNSASLNMQILRSNKWQAARYGLAGRFVDPRDTRKITIAEAARDLLNTITPTAERLRSAKYLEPVTKIIRQGTSADRQRRIYMEKNEFPAVINEIRQEFWQ